MDGAGTGAGAGAAPDAVALHAVGAAAAQGSRPSQQDRHVVFTPEALPREIGERIAIFAVFDGHGSHLVAQHAQTNILQSILASPEFRKGHYEAAMQAAIDKEEETLFKEFRDGEEKFAVAGSTASIAVVNLSSGTLVVGNLGDSHILLAEVERGGGGDGEVKDVRRLTVSHKPDNPPEKQRIEQAGGEVHDQHEIPRLGSLNMSRALGDLQYKKPLNSMDKGPVTEEQTIAAGDPGKERGDFLSRQLATTRVELKRDAQYLLALTTDGVTNAQRDRVIMHSMAGLFGQGLRANEVSESIVKECVSKPGSDNATLISVFLKGSSSSGSGNEWLSNASA
ncbi:phosphatase 2C-like domain-containing protein [Aspergillus karnatakaensis]|uniref:PP2C family serine/threonine-protein phosphatase n=1 Tax=Aspergillus karnatakaensis TaxID=1810916 RepID=UPI003CCD7103